MLREECSPRTSGRVSWWRRSWQPPGLVHDILRGASSKDSRSWALLEVPRCRRVPRSGEKVVNGIIGEEVEDTLRTAIYLQVDPIIAGANACDRFVLFSRHHGLTVRLSIPGFSGPDVAAMVLSTGPEFQLMTIHQYLRRCDRPTPFAVEMRRWDPAANEALDVGLSATKSTGK